MQVRIGYASKRPSAINYKYPAQSQSTFNKRSSIRLYCVAGSGSETGVLEQARVQENSSSNNGTGASTQRRKRVLSGVQPTGNLHIGNYFGAIKNWIGLQDEYDTFYCCVDLHAITLPHDPKELREATFRNAATYLAAGIDPDKSSIFVQSHVTAHTELTWLLSCYTPLGWLRRMVQFKEKVKQREEQGVDAGEEVGSGLMVYPVLMAADILLYQADLVPVGQDQKQHLELARNLAQRMNSLFGGKKWQKRGGRGGRIFKVPEVMIPEKGARVMSLNDGTAKMSKSNKTEASRINILDTPQDIQKKIKVAKTDTISVMEWDNSERPECTNLLTVYSLATGMNQEEVMKDIEGLTFGSFKPRLADALIEHLRPIQEKYKQFESDPGYVNLIFRKYFM
eukprot:TRINITY_DN15633_c0_g1_i2.p1 TRINITY_DN15633_c0_g1~~TRINITY_DN15633_c0_g1_i2.p1  ORF type:complete len:396 (-),score=56.84 TRINITY_DN15633_c0_g1_i2:120-1307(-)